MLLSTSAILNNMATHSVRSYSKKRRKSKSEIDRLVYFAVIIGPVLTLPQVYSIWFDGNKGVSIVSWVAYLVASAIWLIYGLYHKDKPIIVVEVAWIVLEVLIIVGLLRA